MPATVMGPRGQSPRNAPRGSSARKRGGARTDREGDISMDVAGKGRGRVGKSSSPAPNSRDLISRSSTRAGGRGGILSTTARSAILRHAAAGDVSMKESRAGAPKTGLVELKVTGWEKSKASTDADGGVSSLIKWMEKKASHRLGSRTREVKIKKSRVEGKDLIISVASEDVAALVRMSGYGWAGTNVKIERSGGSGQSAPSKETEDLKATFRSVLERRYNFDTKLLDLSALAADEELQKKHIFDQSSTTAKVFPALMRVLELCFDTEEERHAAITSVTLANNNLTDLSPVTTLSQTLPKLQNLDLSNNGFDKLTSLHAWRRRFYHLQHLILSGNPLEQNEPDYAAEIIKWYPNLRMLNTIQVRTEEDIANKSKVSDLPFPIRSALFQDEGGIAETFVRTFFTGFDTDRAALVTHYYDDHSTFSYAVNTSAPRDPSKTDHTEKQEWDLYIKSSRNLKKISQLPARQNRLFRGTQSISGIFSSLPVTKHPDLASEARKWMIEAHIQPGIPDPTGASSAGLDGFLITVHAEFDEIDPSTAQARKTRSFDRSFVIGPGGGPAGVRVVSDMMTIRAYGGTRAFEPERLDGWTDPTAVTQQQQQSVDPAQPQLAPGLTLEMAEQMVAEMVKVTGMTVQYAKDCLEQVAWDFAKGIAAFESVRATLPPEAFVASGI